MKLTFFEFLITMVIVNISNIKKKSVADKTPLFDFKNKKRMYKSENNSENK